MLSPSVRGDLQLVHEVPHCRDVELRRILRLEAREAPGSEWLAHRSMNRRRTDSYDGRVGGRERSELSITPHFVTVTNVPKTLVFGTRPFPLAGCG